MRRLVRCFAAAGVSLGLAAPAVAVTFTEVTATALAGADGAPGHGTIPPGYTGGAAVGDCDRDGDPDLYLTGAAHDVLYRNRGDGTFEDATVASGLGLPAGTRGAAFGDLDDDGDLDLVATAFAGSRHFLFVNDGACRFTEEAAARGLAASGGAIGRGVSLGDYDRDGWLDLFVTELQTDRLNPGVPSPVSRLLRNRGPSAPGRFEDSTAQSGLVLDAVPGPQQGTQPFTARFSDLDHDGWPDVVVAADFRESRLFWNDGAGRFLDGTAAAGVGTDEHGRGVTTADLDGDGRLDLFVTAIAIPGVAGATGNRLYRNAGGRAFADATDAAGVRDAAWAWGTQAFDYDNDGDLDLVATNGVNDDEATRAYAAIDLGGPSLTPFTADPPRLWRNDGAGAFTEVAGALGLADAGAGQGVVAFDYDGDGDQDLLLTHDPQPPRLWRNDGGNAQHWIGVELAGVRSPADGIGARVTVTPARGVRPLVREVSASATYLAQDGTGRVHVGLGARATAVRRLRIEWPSGRVQTLERLAVDTVHRVVEETACTGRARRTDPSCVRARAERRCILALNQGGERVARAVGDRFVACVGGPRAGVEACLATDGDGRVSRALARLEAAADGRCLESPSFGPASADAVGAAAMRAVRPEDVFGLRLGAALLDSDADPAGAACQRAAARGVARMGSALLRAFNRCKRAGSRSGRIATAADLESCHAAMDGPRAEAVTARLGRDVARKCRDVALASALPGKCAGVAPDALLGCLREQARCATCLGLKAADRLVTGCHRYADGVATAYCGDRPATDASAARLWNEALLSAIRADTPRPTTHARNLFHLSAAMWDAWRVYGGGGRAWLTDESHVSADPARDRAIAISFAAYRLLAHRFRFGPGRAATQAALRARMDELGLDAAHDTTAGDTPAAVGNRIAAATIAWGLADGANEQGDYADPAYVPANAPLIVKQPGIAMADPNRWQPLALDVIVAQNGIPLPGSVQTAIGTRWRHVAPFALPPPAVPGGLHVDPGPPPQLGGAGDAAYKAGALRVLELASRLDPRDGVTVDVSPSVLGNNPLGTNDGTGHAVNPATGLPYAPNVVPRADFLRVLAEFWADGPQSETPPGHWNVLANEVSDALPSLRLGGGGAALDRLEWDVKLYLALNGAVHDAAIVAWGMKGVYDSVRPISMIRHLGSRGQSTDPLGPSHAADGLPLRPGLVEVITAETTAPGARHATLAGHEGEIAVFSYPGPPADGGEPAGVRWIRAVEWTSYQQRTFVTPAFPGYTSGHSTFSRAAAEVLTRFTGSPFFPGGLGGFRAAANAYLSFERGPTVDVELQWATYYDAADQAGLSRLAGGIHVPADDFMGRVTGSAVGIGAFAKAMEYVQDPGPSAPRD
jgi:hypothetical protein